MDRATNSESSVNQTHGRRPLAKMPVADGKQRNAIDTLGAITIGPDDTGYMTYKGQIKLLGDGWVSWGGAEGGNRSLSPLAEIPFEDVFKIAA